MSDINIFLLIRKAVIFPNVLVKQGISSSWGWVDETFLETGIHAKDMIQMREQCPQLCEKNSYLFGTVEDGHIRLLHN